MQSNIGRFGEEIAVKYLKQKGYKILERNFRTKLGELDIVCRQRKVIVFVEVKSLAFGNQLLAVREKNGLVRLGSKPEELFGEFSPETHFTPEKLRKVKNTVFAYLKQKRLLGSDFRVDLIAVELSESGELKNMRHYENITV